MTERGKPRRRRDTALGREGSENGPTVGSRRSQPAKESERHLSDEQGLHLGLLQRDIKTFEAIYDRYSRLVYSTALRVVGQPSLAEDVMQEVFLRLWRRPENYAPERGLLWAWLLRVARNRAIDEVRRRRRRLKHEVTPAWTVEEPSLLDEDPLRGAQLADDRRTIQRALAGLPPDQRQVIELAYFGGLTQQEIADDLHQPLGTVKTRIRLGMQKLRTRLTDDRQREDGYGLR